MFAPTSGQKPGQIIVPHSNEKTAGGLVVYSISFVAGSRVQFTMCDSPRRGMMNTPMASSDMGLPEDICGRVIKETLVRSLSTASLEGNGARFVLCDPPDPKPELIIVSRFVVGREFITQYLPNLRQFFNVSIYKGAFFEL